MSSHSAIEDIALLLDSGFPTEICDAQEFKPEPGLTSTPRPPPRHQEADSHLGEYIHPHDLAHSRSADCPEPTDLRATYPHLASLYTAVLRHGIPIALGAQAVVPSGLNIQAWHTFSMGHPCDEVVLDGVTFGFSLQYHGLPIPTTRHTETRHTENHKSARDYRRQVDEYVELELGKGALIGPCVQPPFDWVHVSPMKSSTDNEARRIIVDLSFPPLNNVNMAITPNVIYSKKFAHTLPTVDNMVHLTAGKDDPVFLYSVDISRAYRNFPIDPMDWPLTCILNKGLTMIDLAMPFGARSLSLQMQLSAEFICRYLSQQGANTLIYLDDLVCYAPDYERACNNYALIQRVMRSLGLPLAENKLSPPTRTMTSTIWMRTHYRYQRQR